MEFLLFNGCVNSMLVNETVLITLQGFLLSSVFHHRRLGQFK